MFGKNYICVTGILGAGKSGLVALLAKEFDFEPGLEGVSENPHLEAFFGDMKKHALAMSLWDLDHRLRRHKGFLSRIASNEVKGVVQENTLWEGPMFAGMLNGHPDKLLSDSEYAGYMERFHGAVAGLPFPQLIVYLDCSLSTAMARLRERGLMQLEGAISEEYIRGLRGRYDEFLKGLASAGARILRLAWDTVLPASEAAKLVRKRSAEGEAQPPMTSFNRTARRALATLFILLAGVPPARSLEVFKGWHGDAEIHGGGLIAGKEIGKDVNATGGEHLIARLPTGPFFLGRFGLDSDLFGFGISGAVGGKIEVRNEYGTDFPNHGGNFKLLSGDLVVYPLRRGLFQGKLRPYTTASAGWSFFSVDLDNVNDQSGYSPWTWSYGGGLRYCLYSDDSLDDYSAFLDLGFRNYRVSGSGPIRSFSAQAVTLGLVVRS